ncbi:MAG: phosphatase PAP2 family protein [Bacteroidota bacterium]
MIFYVLLGMILTDQISSQLIKPMVGRDRPCKEITLNDRVEPLVRCGSGKSFPSSHAANHFGIALIIGLGLRRMIPWLIWGLGAWAALISICQVFVGVHYPSDVFIGALLGIIIGAILGKWYVQAEHYL